MKRLILPVIVALAVTGCVKRVGVFAPRRPDTADHRGALSRSDCIECHDVAGLPEHTSEENCPSCHAVIPGR